MTWRGHLYDLEFSQTPRFRAAGLDVAERIQRRVVVAIEAALAADPEVLEFDRRAYLSARPTPCDRTRDCPGNLHYSDCAREKTSS